MGIVLLRVDERLIHGQVVIGWGHELRPARYVVVDDEIAETDWEQQLYTLGAPGAESIFCTVAEGRELLSAWASDPTRTVVLTRDVNSMRRLLAGRGDGLAVNLGGLHAGPDRVRCLDYLHLTEQDRQDLRSLADEGVVVSARDLPDAHLVSLETILS